MWVSIDPGNADATKSAPPVAAAPPPPPPPPPAPPSEPELIIETTSVGAVIDANMPTRGSEPSTREVHSVSEPVVIDEDPVVEIAMTREEPRVAAREPIALKPAEPSEAIKPSEPIAPRLRAHVGVPPIDRLFHKMCEVKASDLHLSVGMPPLVRKDGEIALLEESAPAFDPESMWQMLDPIMPERNREEFERRHDTDFAYEISGLGRFRSNIFMDRKGPGAVFRVIPSKILTAEDLGLSPFILKLCHLNKGLVLVTGPTGSGKSTTLCAMVDYINRTRRDHIITIEDPIEFVHENKQCLMNQREVHTHTDGFKDALRAALREDPDIVLVGEMRDLETVAIAIETAETGHLVFGTLHTTTAASTVDRVIDQFPTDRQAQIRIMLSESLKGVIAQNLCKKIGGGRAAALEVLIVTSAVSNLIREAKTFQIPSIMQVGKSVGMVSLNDALMDLVAKKLVAPEEAYAKSVDKTGFEALLKRAGIDTKFAAAAKEN
jgi:twitching motility protein PilT